MTDLNPYQAQPQVPVQSDPAKKPTSVTVFGVLNCVFGGLGLICTPFGLLVGVASMQETMEATNAYRIWIIAGGIVGVGFSIWLLVLGIGLLMMKGWARRGCLAYAWIMIVWNIVGVVINIAALSLDWVSMPEANQAGFIGGTAGGFCGGLIYPILLLVFMQTDKVKQAFLSKEQPVLTVADQRPI